jgi:sulfur-oxidizing protein SoxZ
MSSIRIKTQLLPDGQIELRLLIQHPMQNGRNREPLTGELIAAHFIETLSLTCNGKALFEAELGASVAQNPFFSLRLQKLNDGDRLMVQWRDNLGNSDQAVSVFER